jgi:beta-1,4-N-acetylglucosaminyltransferase
MEPVRVMTQHKCRPVVLVVLSGGGFLFETRCLLAPLSDCADFVYLRTEFGGLPGEEEIPDGESRLVPTFATKTKTGVYRSIYAFLSTFWATLGLVRQRNVDAILCVGCSHSVPMFLAGRMLGATTIYIESITRVDRLSMSGKIVYFLRLANTFIVQWPDLRNSYASSRLGSVL